MGCLRRIFGLIGLVLFLVGLAALFLAIGPQLNTESRELGGASTTQDQVAAQAFGGTFDEANLPDLPLVIDGQESTTNSVNTAPEIQGEALQDMSSVDSNEQAAAAEVQSLQTPQAGDFTASGLSTDSNAVIDRNTEVELVPLNVAEAAPSDPSGQGGAGGVGGVEQRLVELEWPASFRVGGSGSVRLTLKALPSGEVEVVPEIDDNAIVATPILLTDRYDTHTANFTARLIAPEFGVTAVTPETQILGRGEEGTWRWSLDAPDNSGRFVITLGIDVTWTPTASGAVQEGPRPIWGQALQVDANYVFGSITVPQASLGGSVLAVLGFVIQIPLLGEILGGVWKLLFGRRRRRQDNRARR